MFRNDIFFFRKPKTSKFRNFKFRNPFETQNFQNRRKLASKQGNSHTFSFLFFYKCEIMEENHEDGVEEQLQEDSSVGMNTTCSHCALEFVLTLLSAGGDDMISAAGTSEVTIGVLTPEIATEDEAKSAAEKVSTILDWVKENYHPPPPHPSTLEVFELLGLEYISSFEVDPEEVALINIGRRTDELRFEIFVFSKLKYDIENFFNQQ